MVGIKINLGSYEAAIFCKGLDAERELESAGEMENRMLGKTERAWREEAMDS